jgi:hypothetical protein
VVGVGRRTRCLEFTRHSALLEQKEIFGFKLGGGTVLSTPTAVVGSTFTRSLVVLVTDRQL